MNINFRSSNIGPLRNLRQQPPISTQRPQLGSVTNLTQSSHGIKGQQSYNKIKGEIHETRCREFNVQKQVLSETYNKINDADFGPKYNPLKKHTLALIKSLQDEIKSIRPHDLNNPSTFRAFLTQRQKFFNLQKAIPILRKNTEISQESLDHSFNPATRTEKTIINGEKRAKSYQNFWTAIGISNVKVNTNVDKYSNLLEANSYKKNEIVAKLVDILIDDQGKINLDLIDTLISALAPENNPEIISKDNNNQIVTFLKQLKEPNSKLFQTLNETGMPYLTSKVANILSATLNLPLNTNFNEVHAKKALLSAMLSDLRQGQVGSCFTSSVANYYQKTDPLTILNDLKEILTTGTLHKVINGQSIELPIPDITIPSEYSKVSPNELKDLDSFKNSPALLHSLQNTYGMDEQAAQSCIQQYMLQKIDSAEKYLIGIHDKKDFPIITKYFHQLKSRILKGHFTLPKEFEDKKNEKIALFLTERLSEFLSFDNKELLTNQALSKTGITTQQIKNYKKILHLNQQIQHLTAINSPSKIKQLEAERNALVKTLNTDFEKRLANFEQFNIHSQSAFLSHEKNSLLTTWEYTIAHQAMGPRPLTPLTSLLSTRLGVEDVQKDNQIFNLMAKKPSSFDFLSRIVGTILELFTVGTSGSVLKRLNFLSINNIISKTKGFKKLNAKESKLLTDFISYDLKRVFKHRLTSKYEGGSFVMYDKSTGKRILPEDIPLFVSNNISNIIDRDLPGFFEHNNFSKETQQHIRNALKETQVTILSDKFLEKIFEVSNSILLESQGVKFDNLNDIHKKIHSGGYNFHVLNNLGANNNFIEFNASPESLTSNIINELTKRNLHKEKNINVLVSNHSHGFLINPDKPLLDEFLAIKPPIPFNDWVKTKTRDNPDFIFKFADLNWERKGQHCYLGLRFDPQKKIFQHVIVNENNEYIQQPGSDMGHAFEVGAYCLEFIEKN